MSNERKPEGKIVRRKKVKRAVSFKSNSEIKSGDYYVTSLYLQDLHSARMFANIPVKDSKE